VSYEVVEGKPGETVELRHRFLGADGAPRLAQGPVGVSVLDYDWAVVAGGMTAELDGDGYKVNHLIHKGAPLGVYFVEWSGVFGEPAGTRITEYSILNVVLATRFDLTNVVLNMPSRIVTPDGVTIEFNDKLSSVASMRPVEVGRVTRNRTIRRLARRWEYGER
jgi:hypothetical protein